MSKERPTFEDQSRHRLVAVRSMRKSIDVVTGFAAVQILGGKEISIEEMTNTLKNVGVADAVPADVLAAARSLADRKRDAVKDRIGKADPNLIRELANENVRQRLGRPISDAVINCPAVSDATDEPMRPDSYYRRRWFENPFVYIPLWLVFWASALGAVYLCWKFFALPFDWFDDLMWDWFGSQSARHCFAWTATALAWSVLAVVLIFHRRIAKGAFHIVIAVIRTLRRWFGRIEEVTRP